MKMIKRLERLKNTVNKYMADLRPTSQNGSWSTSTTRCIIIVAKPLIEFIITFLSVRQRKFNYIFRDADIYTGSLQVRLGYMRA
jgi:hypothetical protein